MIFELPTPEDFSTHTLEDLVENFQSPVLVLNERYNRLTLVEDRQPLETGYEGTYEDETDWFDLDLPVIDEDTLQEYPEVWAEEGCGGILRQYHGLE